MRRLLVHRVVLCLLPLVAVVSVAVAADVLAQLGLTESRARQDLVSALSSGFPSIGEAPAKAFRAAAPALRVELVTGAIAWAKAYTASPEFKSAYAKLREDRKPSPGVKSADDAVKKQQTEMSKQADEMKKMLASLPPEQRAAMEASVKEMLETLAKQQKDPAFQEAMRQAAVAEYEEDKARYESSLEEWRTNFPENPNALLARRIKSFLEVSGTVDFGARLVSKDGKMRFVNEEYEGKSSQWKLCFRAGKDTVAAARTAAGAWLVELER